MHFPLPYRWNCQRVWHWPFRMAIWDIFILLLTTFTPSLYSWWALKMSGNTQYRLPRPLCGLSIPLYPYEQAVAISIRISIDLPMYIVKNVAIDPFSLGDFMSCRSIYNCFMYVPGGCAVVIDLSTYSFQIVNDQGWRLWRPLVPITLLLLCRTKSTLWMVGSIDDATRGRHH